MGRRRTCSHRPCWSDACSSWAESSSSERGGVARVRRATFAARSALFFVILGAMFRALGTLVFAGLLFAPPQVRVQGLDGGAPTVDPFAAPAGTRAIVFLFTATDCPISNRFAPEVRR